jgi:[ribosomal protein S5]-alanine N-acetyltransferase
VSNALAPPFPILETSRLRLIPLSRERLKEMHEYSLDSKLYSNLEFGPPKVFQETETYFEKLTSRISAGNSWYWFIEYRDSARIIGTFGVHSIDRRKGSAEVGYGFHSDFWGQGLFKEVLDVVLKFLFENGYQRVSATTPEQNIPSIRGLSSMGFVKEGVLRSYYLSANGERWNAVILAKLKS